MSYEEEPKIKKPFKPHPNLGSDLNRVIENSELLGALNLETLRVGARVEVWTHNSRYVIEKRGDGYYISGNEEFCPRPTKVDWIGSVWSSSTSIKSNILGRGMNLQFHLPWQQNERIEGTDLMRQPNITTSPIENIRELTGSSDEEILEEYEREVKEARGETGGE